MKQNIKPSSEKKEIIILAIMYIFEIFKLRYFPTPVQYLVSVFGFIAPYVQNFLLVFTACIMVLVSAILMGDFGRKYAAVAIVSFMALIFAIAWVVFNPVG
ncbi:MAG: hypothetical protein JRN10_08530 [Nitrososphaerota archaeon]|nr:hypothetical protein [Nitrososphaerota archaeon]MDG6931263.1 hypothetical protein [Nitrososphaerota archaeon]